MYQKKSKLLSFFLDHLIWRKRISGLIYLNKSNYKIMSNNGVIVHYCFVDITHSLRVLTKKKDNGGYLLLFE